MSNFQNLKQNRGSLTALTAALDAAKKTYASDDPRFWYPEVDKAGNGTATLRFLPAPPQDGDNGAPWVKLYVHRFQGGTLAKVGSWFIENCPTTIGKDCPVCDANRTLWNAENNAKANQALASKRKRNLQYFSNALVIADPATPENEGRVVIYRFGARIFDKIEKAIKPVFADQQPIAPDDFWTGANFKLRITKVEGQRSYDSSLFMDPSPLSTNDKELEAIWNKEFSLAELVDPKLFKTYDELKSKFEKVIMSGVTVSMDTQVDAPTKSPLKVDQHDDEQDEVGSLPETNSKDAESDELALFRQFATKKA